MRTDSTAIAGVAMGEARAVIARALRRATTRCPRAASIRTQAEGRPGGPRGDPADQLRARPGRSMAAPQGRRAAPLPAHLAARHRLPDGGQGDGDDQRRARGRALRPARQRHADALRRLHPRLHGGPRRRGRRRGRADACRRSPRATGRRARRHPDAALHRAAAALHGGDAHQGARGARHRPALDVRGDHLDDRRSRLRQWSASVACTRSSWPAS